MTRLKHHDDIYGYLIFAIKRNGKVWEANEISTLMYYANAIILELLSYKLEEENNPGILALERAGRIAEEYGLSDMTLDEINEEIAEARK